MEKSLENQDTQNLNKLLFEWLNYNTNLLTWTANRSATLGLSLLELVVIELVHLEPQTPSQLQKRTCLSSGAMTSLLDRLEQQGYVQRQAHPSDRRSVLVRYQTQPPEKTQAQKQAMLKVQNLLTEYSSKDQATIERFLRDMNAFMQQPTLPNKK
jgi:DNA-binding MarR family transcriptional regulator